MSGATNPGDAGAGAGRQVATLAQVDLGQRCRMHLIAAIAVAFLAVYGRIVCPFVDGVDLGALLLGLVGVCAGQIVLREVLYRAFPRPWGSASLARHGMYVALISWLVAGLMALGLHVVLYPDFPFSSHVKLLVGYWALGGGILSQLEFIMLERYLREHGTAETTDAQSVELITRRLMESYGVFTAVPALILMLLAFREVYEKKAGLHDALEITFVGLVFVVTALLVSWRYGVALREDCKAIRDAVHKVASGEFDVDLDASRPDELGLVARGIGEMGRGLAVREKREAKLLQITSAFSEELRLDKLLGVITTGATELLNAERSSLFLYDPRRDQLWTPVAEGMEGEVIHLAKDAGLAGATFSGQATISLDDVRADPRFDPGVDKRTGFETRTMLCVPVNSKEGKHLGVIQVLNRREGTFGPRDESRLRALASQASTAIENAQLFEDVLNLKNYGESILRSLSNGVVSLDCDLRIAKMNEAAERVLGHREADCVGRTLAGVLGEGNAWVVESARKVATDGGEADHVFDTDLVLDGGRIVSVNLTTEPLVDSGDELIGLLLVMEDLSAEKRVRSTMSRYMPKRVVEQVLEGGADVLEGRSQTMTLLFTDIRSFTSISEAIGARATVKMLNEYFTDMVDVIHQHGGILDKYIGDAIMALFGVPFSGAHDERSAVAAANDMMRALVELNVRRVAEGLDPLMHGIGVNTGEAVAGNIGSPRRMDYTVIGDSVNLAARLESITKFYGTAVLVSDSTRAKLGSGEHLREVDRIRVKGKSQPATLYESYEWRAADATDEVLRSYAISGRALAAYRAQEWEAAAELFGQARVLAPEDKIPGIYLERTAHYREQPPGAGWDGVWTMTSK